MGNATHVLRFRVRYSETDQMRTYYNSRPLEWFERGRTELLRAMGKPYREMEQSGVLLPVKEAHVEYLGRAEYDDLLQMTCTLLREGKAQVRVDVEIDHAESGRPVCRGYTVHVVTDASGKPMRPPKWLIELIESNGQ
ncbi:MAG: acyl-CoA thioesterase [Planctomycetota bacterium]